MSAPDDPGRFLVDHRAPTDLLHTAMQRAAQPSPIRSYGTTLAAAAAALVVGLAGGWIGHSALQTPAQPGGLDAAIALGNTDVVPVRLVIHAPEAQAVAVAGSFNGWDTDSIPLVRGDNGTWHTTVRLPPGRYEYQFVVDGDEWVGDPSAPLTAPDDFGRANAILEV